MAFIDADARPFPDWLNNAIKYLSVTKWERLVGLTLHLPKIHLCKKGVETSLHLLLLGDHRRSETGFDDKFINGLEVKELPSCNLIVKKEFVLQVGGFDTSILTGEDAKLVLKLENLARV